MTGKLITCVLLLCKLYCIVNKQPEEQQNTLIWRNSLHDVSIAQLRVFLPCISVCKQKSQVTQVSVSDSNPHLCTLHE